MTRKQEIFLILSLIFLSMWGISNIYRKWTNTLQSNGKWIVSKTLLEKTVMGAGSFLEKTQALDQGKLHLGAWHGFQEVIYNQKIIPKIVSFNFFLTKDSYFFFIFNKQKETFSAIRFSGNLDYDNQFITALNSGEFTSKKTLNIKNLEINRWHKATIHFDNLKETVLTVNGQAISLNISLSPSEYLGFRGSLSDSIVDNFVIKTEKGEILKDSFENNHQVKIILIAFFVFIFFFLLFYFLLPKLFSFSQRKTFLITLSFFATTFIFITTLFLYLTFFYVGRYPTLKSFFNWIKAEEKIYVQSEAEKINTIIMERYEEQNNDATRILFIGTSQTWGAGADKEENTFISLAEKYTNQNSTKKYEFINAGISGVTSDILSSLYEKNWIKLNPKIVFVNLATNDDGNDVPFKKNLQQIIDLNKKQGISTVLLLEANSDELAPDGPYLHSAMVEIAEKNNIQYYNLHTYLKEKKQSGIIWWDFVHPTSYGHQLISEVVLKAVNELPQ